MEPQNSSSANKLGSPIWIVFITLAIFIASQVVIAPLIIEAAYIPLNPHRSPNFDNSIPIQFFFILIAELAAAFLVISIVQKRHLKLKVIGLGRWPVWRDLRAAAAGFLAFYLLLVISNILVTLFVPDITNGKQNLGFEDLTTGTQSLMAFVALVLLPPIGEEILIRGYLFSGLRMVWRFWPAVVVTSLFFGLAHLEFGRGGPLVWAAALDTFLLSVVLCFLRERTGALYAGMLVHMLNNLLAFGIHFK